MGVENGENPVDVERRARRRYMQNGTTFVRGWSLVAGKIAQGSFRAPLRPGTMAVPLRQRGEDRFLLVEARKLALVHDLGAGAWCTRDVKVSDRYGKNMAAI